MINRKATAIKALLTTAVMLALLFLLLSACNGEISLLSAKNESIFIKVNESKDIYELVNMEGDGKLSFSVENTDVLGIKGSKIIGLKEGKANLIVMGGDFAVTITVEVGLGNKVRVELSDTTAVYNGKVFNIAVNGILPQGAELKFYSEGKEFLGATEAGSYIVTAKLSLPKGYVEDFIKDTAILTINKAHYDMSGVTFPSRTLIYNGKEQVVAISGTLPVGISVKYEGNRAIDVGDYRAKAVFSGENSNYEKIGELICAYTIKPAVVSLADCGWGNNIKTYDGSPFTVGATVLPSGASAEYFSSSDGETFDKLASAPSFINAGLYYFYAKLKANEKINTNYTFTTETQTITLSDVEEGIYESDYIQITVKINKAVLDRGKLVLRDKNGALMQSAEYGKSISIGGGNGDYILKCEGDMPLGIKKEFEGVTVQYSELALNSFGNLDSGIHALSATYLLPENYTDNYEVIRPLNYDLRVFRAVYDTSEIIFSTDRSGEVYNGNEFFFEAEGVDKNIISVSYSIKKDGGVANRVLHAGEYEIIAKFTLLSDALNYLPIDDKTIKFTVYKREIDIGSVSFINAKLTYDGLAHALLINGELPEDVSVKYEPLSNYTDAGQYPYTATFFYKEGVENSNDYIFIIDGKKKNSLSATLTIEKADYLATEISDNEFITQEDLTYEYGMKLSDVGFNDNSDGFVRWKNPDALIGSLLTLVTDESKGTFTAEALYNADKINHNDFTYRAVITLNKKVLDLTGFRVENQFVVQNAGRFEEVSVLFSGTDYSNETNTVMTFTGINTATIELVAEKPSNYILNGEYKFENVKIYGYDKGEYTYKKGTTQLIAYNGMATMIAIPNGTTSISARAFDSTEAGSCKVDVLSVTVPESIISLSQNVFYGMRNLDELNFESLACTPEFFRTMFGSVKPSSIKVKVKQDTEIADKKFYGVDYIKEVIYNQPITNIGKEAFAGCSSLEKLSFNCSQLIYVGTGCFVGCIALESLRLPYLIGEDAGISVSVTHYFGTSLSDYTIKTISLTTENEYTIIDSAFVGLSSLEEINLSPSFTALGARAFKNINAPLDLSASTITVISDYVFADYNGISVTLPASIEKIGRGAFKNASNLLTLSLPKTVSVIGAEAFSGCFAEIRFDVNSMLINIGSEAFSNYKGKKVVLPQNVKAIGEKAFAYSDVEKVIIGNKVESIGEKCFENCANLVEFTITQNVTTIGSWAFINCSELVTIYFDAMTPPNSAINVYGTKGVVLTVKIKTGANANIFETYMDECGKTGEYVISRIL